MVPHKIVRRTLLTLCLSMSMVAASSLLFAEQAKAALNEADSVMSVVYTFYKNYMATDGVYSVTEYLRAQTEVDAAFVEQLESAYKEAENSGLESLDHDPVLMAQDYPHFMQYSRPVINGASANVIAYGIWRMGGSYPICVSLVKKTDAWRISSVNHMDVKFGGSRDCGGMKPAP